MSGKFNYAKSQNTAARLIAKFGGRGAILKLTPGSPKPSYVAHPVDMVVLDYRVDQVDGTRIRSTDKQIFVSVKGLSIEIGENDRIQDPSGKVMEIVPPVMPLNPSGSITVLVELQGRA